MTIYDKNQTVEINLKKNLRYLERRMAHPSLQTAQVVAKKTLANGHYLTIKVLIVLIVN